MADQLSLRLEADRLPELPVLRPMLPRPLPDPFNSAAHLFEPWWGGERALISLGPAELPGTGAVRIVDAAGVDRTDVPPRAIRAGRARRRAVGDPRRRARGRRRRRQGRRRGTGAPIVGRPGPARRVPRIRPARARRSIASVAAARQDDGRLSDGCCGPATKCLRCRRSRPTGSRSSRRPSPRASRSPCPATIEPIPPRSEKPVVALCRRPTGCRRTWTRCDRRAAGI